MSLFSFLYVLPGTQILLQPLLSLAIRLPYSRDLEREADEIGLHIMANACYDPAYAKLVQKRLGDLHKDQPDILSYVATHPPSSERIANIDHLLKEIRPRYLNHCVRGKQQPQKKGFFSFWG